MNNAKILFANAPFDGHFNPLTGLAVHLQNAGYDVRWYTGKQYEKKIQRLNIPFYPFKRTVEVSQENLNELFPERVKIKGAISRIKFDIKHCFINSAIPQFEDIKDIVSEFDFDMMICDNAFTGSQLVKEKLGKPVVVVGVTPLGEASRDLPPTGLGITPSQSFIGKGLQSLMRVLIDKLVFKESSQLYDEVITAYGLAPVKDSIFNIAVRYTDLYLQIGVPGLEYSRSDMSKKVRFIGPLLPYKQANSYAFAHADKLKKYKKVILVSQGTVDNKEPEKLIVPTIEALKDSPYLILAATGFSKTEELRKRYGQANVIIEDFIDFSYIMPHVDVFVTNGGYGSTFLGLTNNVPIVAAGVHEGKNEICARIGYFRVGINLKTERPKPARIKKSVETILSDDTYKQNVSRLKEEFNNYSTLALCEQYISEILKAKAEPSSKLKVVR
jgi:UDP:flavonoid glycosyltransferase YjiC (YdhE family)